MPLIKFDRRRGAQTQSFDQLPCLDTTVTWWFLWYSASVTKMRNFKPKYKSTQWFKQYRMRPAWKWKVPPCTVICKSPNQVNRETSSIASLVWHWQWSISPIQLWYIPFLFKLVGCGLTIIGQKISNLYCISIVGCRSHYVMADCDGSSHSLSQFYSRDVMSMLYF